MVACLFSSEHIKSIRVCQAKKTVHVMAYTGSNLLSHLEGHSRTATDAQALWCRTPNENTQPEN